MKYIYAFICVTALGAVSYVAGVHVGAARCRADAANARADAQINMIKQMEKIDEKVFNTNTTDIRDRLRHKYTIKD